MIEVSFANLYSMHYLKAITSAHMRKNFRVTS